MITVPTVLILGAGASEEYGFPVGRAFKNAICELEGNFVVALGKLGLREQAHEFIDCFRHSRIPSPDRFLEGYEEYLEAGKLCIAKVIASLEDDRNVFSNTRHRQPWYEYLVTSLDPDDPEYENNALTIITFNYDRSLEYYMWKSFVGDYFHDEDKKRQLWRNKPEIIHLHGLLGDFNPLNESGRPYSTPESPEGLSDDIVTAANGIQIIHEVNPDTEAFNRAEIALRSAERIVFLGFGFDQLNIQRLRVFDDGLSGKKIEGTRWAISEKYWGEIVDSHFPCKINARAFDNMAIVEFLQRTGL